ncbi:type IV pilus modification PilV family protein [Candidatus Aalborgicola defluviihabitans]|uniref:type IV pilus modification PilV family protein n=1 Tax=Candidatus Aalborgicola defluviihabitans TaxID=3386187 RepID=UPI0039B8D6A9
MTMQSKCRGMTLIEVLVAFVVLSVTMAAILQIFSGGMRNARLADSYSRAVFLAESKLAAAGIERPLVPGEEVGQITDMQWRLRVQPFDDGGAADRQLMPSRLYLIQAQIGWNEDGRPRQVVLESLRLGLRQ